ncbi:MAG TPA: PQQ-binding-like beta-propeller repeat protein [Chitinophagaceae bacterium]|nr:PQQ-binding-like beta-propeller repeat protein [Chitinophagaceae bacterium]
MRRATSSLALLAVSITLFATWAFVYNQPSANSAASTTDSVSDGRDILPDILSLNNNRSFSPPKTFRQGHVTTTTIKNYLQQTDYGYYIKLPVQTLVPTPAVVNGKVYLSGGFGSKQYYAFDAVTGQLAWGINLDDDGPSSPAIQDSIIVFNTESCTIFACDLVTGKQLWSYWLGDPLMSMPTIANGIVFTAYPAPYRGNEKAITKSNANTNTNAGATNASSITPTHVLIAIELKTGKILWQKWIDSDIMTAPVAKDDLLYVTTFSGALYKIKQSTGEILEAKAIRATSAPVFSNLNEVIVSQRDDKDKDTVLSEVVVVGSGTKKKTVYKKQADYLDKKVQERSKLKSSAGNMDAGNGFAGGAPANANWKAGYLNIGQSNVSSLQSFQGSRGLYDKGKLYNTMGDEIVCTDSTGKVTWRHKLSGDLKNEGGFMGTPPIYANGHIIVATFTGDVLIFDEKEGKIIRQFHIKDPIRYQPVADNGWIYVTTVNGRMHAINTGNPRITGWNMWGANAARTNVSASLH